MAGGRGGREKGGQDGINAPSPLYGVLGGEKRAPIERSVTRGAASPEISRDPNISQISGSWEATFTCTQFVNNCMHAIRCVSDIGGALGLADLHRVRGCERGSDLLGPSPTMGAASSLGRSGKRDCHRESVSISAR